MSGDAAADPGRSARNCSAPIELWCVDLPAASPALGDIERRTPRLSSGDRERAKGFSDRGVVAERLATYIALRILIERAAGPDWRGAPLQHGAHGKPHIGDAPVAFSYSHAPGLALIGVARIGPSRREAIGVDIEPLRPVRVRAPRRAAIEVAGAALAEHEALPSGAEARFLQAWVRLEALAKLNGTGIGRLMTRLGIMGARGATNDDIRARVERVRAEQPATAVHDLHLGAKLFAALAAPVAASFAQPRWIPTSVAGIEALLGDADGFDVDRAGGAGQKGAGGA